ncbi:MAG TPA: hypothetical protein EYM65_08885 [Dehalococcoidia bacterium]|nr:hypothetical protein [Dehalococcoidia bacterium]
MIKDMVANRRVESFDGQSEPSGTSVKTGLLKFVAKKGAGSVILYAMAALVLAGICSFAFNALGQDTEFAIAVMGSLIGGFLGAMLAAALIIDIYMPRRSKDQQ